MGLALPHHFTADFYSAPIAHDIERARQQLGYSSRYEIPESIGRTVSLGCESRGSMTVPCRATFRVVRLALSVRRVRYCHYQAIPRGRT